MRLFKNGGISKEIIKDYIQLNKKINKIAVNNKNNNKNRLNRLKRLKENR